MAFSPLLWERHKADANQLTDTNMHEHDDSIYDSEKKGDGMMSIGWCAATVGPVSALFHERIRPQLRKCRDRRAILEDQPRAFL